jgi:hypothetical protein
VLGLHVFDVQHSCAGICWGCMLLMCRTVVLACGRVLRLHAVDVQDSCAGMCWGCTLPLLPAWVQDSLTVAWSEVLTERL